MGEGKENSVTLQRKQRLLRRSLTIEHRTPRYGERNHAFPYSGETISSMQREVIPALIANHMPALPADAQAFLAASLQTFHGTCERESSKTKADKTSFVRLKSDSGSPVIGAQSVKRVITDYGTSPLGLQLALLEGAATLSQLSGAAVSVGLVPGVRTSKPETKPETKPE